MNTTAPLRTTTVARVLREAGIPVGGNVRVRPGRDVNHLRVLINDFTVTERRRIHLTKYATDVLRLNGYTVEPGIVPWMLVVTR